MTKYVFIDFDDTIFPSSQFVQLALLQNKIDMYDLNVDSIIKNNILNSNILLVDIILKLINNNYIIVIVSCATITHITTCLKQYCTNLSQLFDKITIIANDTFTIIKNAAEWKFNKIIQFIEKNNSCHEIFAIGNTENDRLAILKVGGQLKCITKTIKLIEYPTCYYIFKQWEFLNYQLDLLINLQENVDYYITIKQEKLQN